jgi:hypothetical protein
MKGLVDKSIGIVTRITEALARIKPTEPLRLDKREARKNETVPIPQVILRPKYYLHDVCVRKTVVQSPHRHDPKCLR